MDKYIKASVQGAVIGIMVFLSYEGVKSFFNKPQATQKPEPCHCLTYEEISAYTARYEVYVDSNQNGCKADRERFKDSVDKYSRKLNIK